MAILSHGIIWEVKREGLQSDIKVVQGLLLGVNFEVPRILQSCGAKNYSSFLGYDWGTNWSNLGLLYAKHMSLSLY